MGSEPSQLSAVRCSRSAGNRPFPTVPARKQFPPFACSKAQNVRDRRELLNGSRETRFWIADHSPLGSQNSTGPQSEAG
jgi:hypothetical protein